MKAFPAQTRVLQGKTSVRFSVWRLLFPCAKSGKVLQLLHRETFATDDFIVIGSHISDQHIITMFWRGSRESFFGNEPNFYVEVRSISTFDVLYTAKESGKNHIIAFIADKVIYQTVTFEPKLKY